MMETVVCVVSCAECVYAGELLSNVSIHFMCICCAFLSVCVHACVTYAADTLQHLGHSLHHLGND